MELARKENTLKRFSGEGNKGNKTYVELNV
jgi:hypothetical protein